MSHAPACLQHEPGPVHLLAFREKVDDKKARMTGTVESTPEVPLVRGWQCVGTPRTGRAGLYSASVLW